jgi:hypothetical protein
VASQHEFGTDLFNIPKFNELSIYFTKVLEVARMSL